MIFFIICFLIILLGSSFFSASETAITCVSRAKIHQLTKQGNKQALIIKELQNNLSMVISALLAYNTLLNAAMASVLASITFDLVGDNSTAAAVISSLFTGTIVLVFAEMIPKTFALQYSLSFLLFFAKQIQFFYNIFLPFNKALSWFAVNLLKVLGVNKKDESNVSIEELKGVIDMHNAPGQDTPHEKAMLKSILDLGSVRLVEIMVHRQNVSMINIDEKTSDIVDQVLSSPYTRIPLYKNNTDNVVGVINTKALLRAVRAHKGDIENLNILEIASLPWFVPENTDLLEQLHAFRQRREHFSLVIDEYGALMGIVTLEDILEEIVGDIVDEHDIAVKGVRQQPDGSYVIYGNVTLRDLNRQFDWGFCDENAATIAGFLLHQFRIIPAVGQIFHYQGFRFEVLRKQRNQIMLIKIYPPTA